MYRGVIPRFPFLRTFIPRISVVSRPLLPLTSRLAAAPSLSLTSNPNRITQSRLFQHFPARLTSPPHSPNPPIGPGPNASLTDRLKHLIKSYGWYALGVYIILSALDFGVAFAAINLLGAEQVSRLTQSAKDFFVSMIPSTPPEPGREEVETAPRSGQEGLYAMLLLAYTVHKTLFLPIRIGLTAAVTPKLVGWLGKRGWAGGEGTKRAAREMRDRVRRNSREQD